jgi:hypothetical protein
MPCFRDCRELKKQWQPKRSPANYNSTSIKSLYPKSERKYIGETEKNLVRLCVPAASHLHRRRVFQRPNSYFTKRMPSFASVRKLKMPAIARNTLLRSLLL